MGMEARLHGVTVTLNPQQLSDLFYRHQHPRLEALEEFERQEPEVIYDAVLQDAQSFASELGVKAEDYPDFAQDLAANYQRRLP